jgi:hypothetical protein
MAKTTKKGGGKKPTAKKTTAKAEPKPRAKRPAKQTAMEIDDGQDPDLRAAGEEFLDARAAKREADGDVKKKRDALLDLMERKGVETFVLDGITFMPVDKGTTLRTQQPRKPKKSKRGPMTLEDAFGADEDDTEF